MKINQILIGCSTNRKCQLYLGACSIYVAIGHKKPPLSIAPEAYSEFKYRRSEATQGGWGIRPPMSQRLFSATRARSCSGSGSPARTHDHPISLSKTPLQSPAGRSSPVSSLRPYMRPDRQHAIVLRSCFYQIIESYFVTARTVKPQDLLLA